MNLTLEDVSTIKTEKNMFYLSVKSDKLLEKLILVTPFLNMYWPPHERKLKCSAAIYENDSIG